MNEQDKMHYVVTDLMKLINTYGIDGVKHALNYIDTYPCNPVVKTHRFLNTAGRDYFLNDADFQRVNALWTSGNKIAAIKEFRFITSAGLKEAKDAVEAFYQEPLHR